MEEARRKILDRRARFVAAALVAAGFVSVERKGEGQTAVAPSPSPSESEVGPSICLSDDTLPEPADAGAESGSEIHPQVAPQPCLTIVRQPAGCGCDTPGRG